MPECDYCEASFGDDDAYLDHLAADHEGELSRIDRRRVGDREGEGGGIPVGPAALVGLLVFTAAVVVYVTFIMGGGTGNAGPSTTINGIQVAESPTRVGSTHFHGTIDVTIDGRQLDFSRPEFQRAAEYDAFHFEGGQGGVWHGHARHVTLEYAMATLGIDVGERAVTFQGTTYRDGDSGTNVTVAVDGESVDPESYVLGGATDPANAGGGDHVRIVVSTNASD